MNARTLSLAALAALLTACGGGEEGAQAGDSATPGATGTIESTSDTISAGAATPVDTLTASDATTAGANGSATAPAATGAARAPAPPADTAHGVGH